MTDNSWLRLRASALDSLGVLQQILQDDSISDRRLVAAYLETKRALAKAFEAYSERYVDSAVLERTRAELGAVISSRYPLLPEKYSRVSGFGPVHAKILAYLVARAGLDVTADELRMLTRDAVHTERRARELRDLGYALDARESGGSSVYVLRDSTPDLRKGAALIAARNVRSDRHLDVAEAERFLSFLRIADA